MLRTPFETQKILLIGPLRQSFGQVVDMTIKAQVAKYSEGK